MALGNTSLVQLRAKPEATLGTTPGTGNHYAVRLVSESLKYAISTTMSNEIRSDRSRTDLIQTQASVSGSLAFELSYGEYDSLLAYALQSSGWANLAGTTGEAVITATFATTTITASTGTPFANIIAGQWVRISGAVNAQNNGWFKVLTATSSTVLTFAASTFTAETSTASVKVQAGRISNGTTLTGVSFERYNSDLTQYSLFRGCAPSMLKLSVKPGSILTGSMDFLGMTGVNPAGSSGMPGTTTASQTGSVYNSVSHVANILEGGSAITGTSITGIDLSLNNNLRGRTAVGSLGYVGLGTGACDITGTVTMYFADATYINKFLNDTASSLSFRVQDSAGGQGYVVTLPAIQYSDASYPTGGINQDVIVTLNFTALRDSTTGSTIIIDRGGSAVTAWA